MTLNPEQWLATHTFWCPGLHARITPRQCATNRRQADGENVGKSLSTCSRCTRWPELCASVGEKRNSMEGGMASLIDCLKCKAQNVENAGRGLCSSCYPRATPKEKKKYSLDEARQTRRKRLRRNEELVSDAPTAQNGELGQHLGEVACEPAEDPLIQKALQDDISGPVAEPATDPANAAPVTASYPAHEELAPQSLSPADELQDLKPQDPDPLEGAELLLPRKDPVIHPMRASVLNNGYELYLNSAVCRFLGMTRRKNAEPYISGEDLLLHLTPKGQVAISTKRRPSCVTAHIYSKKLARKLQWKGREIYRVEPTSREDVIRLVRM